MSRSNANIWIDWTAKFHPVPCKIWFKLVCYKSIYDELKHTAGFQIIVELGYKPYCLLGYFKSGEKPK